MQTGMVVLYAVTPAITPEHLRRVIFSVVHLLHHMMPLRRADLLMSADLHQHEYAVDKSLSATQLCWRACKDTNPVLQCTSQTCCAGVTRCLPCLMASQTRNGPCPAIWSTLQ
jgi:hypothetical protein